MSDRGLLELAAKAAGINIRWHEPPNGDPWCFVPTAKPPHNRRDKDALEGELWNPLEDDGDALRLAVKLCIGLDHNRAGDQQRYVAADRPGCEGCFAPVSCVEDEFDEQQRGAATRRAIVRAAAEIWKTAP